MISHIRLSLATHCIQTAARRAHRELTDALIEDRLRPCAADGGGLADDEARLELLTDFLETHDFAALRAAHPELAGGRPVTVEILRGRAGEAWPWWGRG